MCVCVCVCVCVCLSVCVWAFDSKSQNFFNVAHFSITSYMIL